MEILGRFEEICLPDKEEHLALGTANDIRILGSYADRKIDLTMRLHNECAEQHLSLKKRLKKTRLTKRQQAIVAQTCVESTALFDAAVRPLYESEINKIQREIDRLYRSIWASKNKPPINQIQEKSINMFGVRKQLTIDSMELKIEKRHLIRIGHILRMDNNRLTKQLVLGWPAPEISDQHRKARQTTIGYWKTLMRNAGQDPDTIESLALNRKKYKTFIEERVRRICGSTKMQIKRTRPRDKSTTRREEKLTHVRSLNIEDEPGKTYSDDPWHALTGSRSQTKTKLSVR